MTDVNSQYYNTHATEYFLSTVDVDMQPVYDKFLSKVITHRHILDAGCGSGRDSKVFKSLGFQVTAMDASEKLALLATEHTGIPVLHKTFQEIDEVDCYDAIWCCASLLHVPFDELNSVFSRLAVALKSSGVLYISFKYGEPSIVQREENGRRFTDLNETILSKIVKDIPSLTISSIWNSKDRRSTTQSTTWLNALIIKGAV